jgi:hypothetical protein
MIHRLVLLSFVLLCPSLVLAQRDSQVTWTDPAHGLNVPQEVLQRFKNPDGSCVQCSNGMCGTAMNVPEFASLLEDSEYGKAVRGGSGPSRVAAYAKARGVRIWNITGPTTFEWMRWAAATGRPCAIGAGHNHFQTLKGYDPRRHVWLVVNNNGSQRTQEYDEQAFRSLHLASGHWIVILDYPPEPATPVVRPWWDQLAQQELVP